MTTFKFYKVTQEEMLNTAEKKTFDVLKPGKYEFVIESAEWATSKNNNEMVKLKLNIYDDMGKKTNVWDYLVSSDKDFCRQKIYQFCHSINMSDKYDIAQFEYEDTIGLNGYCNIAIQKADGKYPEKNVVASYIVRSELKEGEKACVPPVIDDEIPF